jgi:hypothetical protein
MLACECSSQPVTVSEGDCGRLADLALDLEVVTACSFGVLDQSEQRRSPDV